MPEIRNTTRQPIETATGYVIPAGGAITVAADALAKIETEPYAANKISKGALVVENVPEPEPVEITRADVSKMRKAELVEVLEAHGMDNPEGTVEDLREMALSVVFLDL